MASNKKTNGGKKRASKTGNDAEQNSLIVTHKPSVSNVPLICALDGTTHPDVKSLHAYIKRFRSASGKRIWLQDYYHKYFPRKDKGTGELIPYRDPEQYFSQEFIDKLSLKRWLDNDPVAGFEWSKQWLIKRKESKELIYPPSHVELRSLTCPSTYYYDKVFAAQGGYYGLCSSIGYKDRYKNIAEIVCKKNDPFGVENTKPSINSLFSPISQDTIIICDTREQLPIILPRRVIRQKLDAGDYGLEGQYDKGIYIERKGLNDFIGSFSPKAFSRLCREIDRANKAGHYIVMMVESSLSDCLQFNKIEYVDKYVKVSPAYIFRNVRDLLSAYPLSFQIVFVNGRIEMSKMIMRVFEMGERVKQYDLQYLYEMKGFNL